MSNMEITGYSDMSNDFVSDVEREEEESTIKPYEVDCLPNDYNITSLISLIDRGYLKIPSFQRNYIWKKDMASKFIESIIIGLPIPQIFLFERGRNNFLVIDGQQRLVTIHLFRKQRFPKNDNGRAIIRKYLSVGMQIPNNELSGDDFEDFKLKLPTTTGDKNLLDKSMYDTLPFSDSFDFKAEFDFNRTIRTITIKQLIPCDDHNSMFEIFSRLNSGGVTLKQQEIRMSLFYSPFYERVVDELNLHAEWRKFLDKKQPDLHMSEVEVLIRAFAMLEIGHQYKAPMRNFLNKFSENAMNYEKDKIDELCLLFNEFWNSCELLEKNAFKNEKNKFVISLFDAVFVSVCEKIREEGLNERKISPASLTALKQNVVFNNASQGSTASTERVDIRMIEAKKTIVLQ